MSNVAYTIPNLIQGVSQQPDAQRDPSQAEIQINGMSSIAEGLRKRDSSRAVAKVSDSLFGDAFIHTIQRDAAEKYISVIRTTAIDVFDLEGTAKTVNIATDALKYLTDAGKDASENVTDARSQIRAVTIADYTFVLNTQRTTEMKADTAPATPRPAVRECLVWVTNQLRQRVSGCLLGWVWITYPGNCRNTSCACHQQQWRPPSSASVQRRSLRS